jgi:RNA polymerase sigma-70 factor, ECF subfamily
MNDDPLWLHLDDLRRARAIARGDEAAFRAFFDQAFPRLFRFAQRHGGDPSLAEEVAQEALVLALEKIPAYRGESSLLTWCFGIARFVLQRRGGQATRLQTFEDELEFEAVLASLRAEDDDDPAQQAARAQAVQRVHAVLDRLPPLYAECLEAKYVLGLSVRELARRQQRSEKSVESTLTRARDAFRDAFLGGLQVEAKP